MNVYECMPRTFYDVYDDLKQEKHNEYLLKGGRGSCKSSFAAIAILRGIMADRNANAIVYRKVANTLKDSVYTKFSWAAVKLNVQEYFRFRRSPLEIEYIPTGQKIMFRGADDPLKSKSIALEKGYFKYLWFEELAEFRGPEDIRSIVQSVLRGGKGLTICTYNPPRSAESWVNVEALMPREDRLIHHSTYLDVPREWLGDRFLLEAETLKRLNEEAYKNEYMGEITGSGGRVFANLELREISPEEKQRIDKHFCGLDFGFAADPDAFTLTGYDSKSGTLYLLDEFVAVHNSADKLSEEVGKRAGRAVVYCDSADPRMINELKKRGIIAVGAIKGVGSREHGYRWLETLRKIVIDPRKTPVAAREFALCEYEKDRNGCFVSAYPDGNDHTIDSVRYALQNLIMSRYAVTRRDVY